MTIGRLSFFLCPFRANPINVNLQKLAWVGGVGGSWMGGWQIVRSGSNWPPAVSRYRATGERDGEMVGSAIFHLHEKTLFDRY